METNSKNVRVIEFVNMFNIMDYFKWDYYTYIKQPKYFIVNCYNYLRAKGEYEKVHKE